MRLRGLGALDPLAVPLPTGTEVSTRVNRLTDEGRRVPQGAVGRVVGEQGGLLQVRLVGVGVVDYQRDELLPRRHGELRFAARREAAWDALAPTVVLESVVGSRAWGLAGEGSDTDRRGVFVLPFPWTTGLATPPQELLSENGSATFWEAGKALRQGLRADPNTLETLFVHGLQTLDEMGRWIIDAREAFVSTEIYGAFGRYALAQLAKLRQSLRLAEHRTLVLEWLRREPTLDLDALAARLAVAAQITGSDPRLRAKEYVKQLYNSLHDQGVAPSANLAGLAAVAADTTLELPRELRPKNAYNLLRLMATAIGWLETGAPAFVVGEPLRTRLLAIKRGEVALAEVLDEAEALAPRLEAARTQSRLPRRADLARIEHLQRRLRDEAARRWFSRAAGPWGAAAPPPPDTSWEDE